MEELDPVKVHSEVRDNVPDGKVFVISKGNRCIGYIAPSEYYNFERFLNTAINGYLDEVNDSYKKADRNPSYYKVIYSKNGKNKLIRKVLQKPDFINGINTENSNRKHLFIKRSSPQDIYSADKQMKQLKSDLKTHGIKGIKDDDSDE